MPHFAEGPFTDDPEQLEALFRLLHGAEPGSKPRPKSGPARRPEPPTLEARFGIRPAAAEPAPADRKRTRSHTVSG